jgi:hypothetical protein
MEYQTEEGKYKLQLFLLFYLLYLYMLPSIKNLNRNNVEMIVKNHVINHLQNLRKKINEPHLTLSSMVAY